MLLHQPNTFSIPSLFKQAQVSHIFRIIFLDPTSPSSYHSIFFPSLLSFFKELSILTASIFSLPTHFSTYLNLYSVRTIPLKSFEKVSRTFMFLNLMGFFCFSSSMIAQEQLSHLKAVKNNGCFVLSDKLILFTYEE